MGCEVTIANKICSCCLIEELVAFALIVTAIVFAVAGSIVCRLPVSFWPTGAGVSSGISNVMSAVYFAFEVLAK